MHLFKLTSLFSSTATIYFLLFRHSLPSFSNSVIQQHIGFISHFILLEERWFSLYLHKIQLDLLLELGNNGLLLWSLVRWLVYLFDCSAPRDAGDTLFVPPPSSQVVVLPLVHSELEWVVEGGGRGGHNLRLESWLCGLSFALLLLLQIASLRVLVLGHFVCDTAIILATKEVVMCYLRSWKPISIWCVHHNKSKLFSESTCLETEDVNSRVWVSQSWVGFGALRSRWDWIQSQQNKFWEFVWEFVLSSKLHNFYRPY